MMQDFRDFIKYVYLACAFLIIPSFAYANGDDALIVSYITAHANYSSEAVQGVLVTPSGDILKTEAMGSYGSQKIVINDPQNGSYSAYFEALIEIKPKYCFIIGGIDAHLSSQPSSLIPFTPVDSHIQGFTQSKIIRINDTTLPIATFQLPLSE
jgi:hypothetical protein